MPLDALYTCLWLFGRLLFPCDVSLLDFWGRVPFVCAVYIVIHSPQFRQRKKKKTTQNSGLVLIYFFTLFSDIAGALHANPWLFNYAVSGGTNSTTPIRDAYEE